MKNGYGIPVALVGAVVLMTHTAHTSLSGIQQPFGLLLVLCGVMLCFVPVKRDK